MASRCAVLLLAATLAGSNVSVAQPASVERPAAADPYATHIAEAARRFAVPERWIRAVMHAESVNDPAALSPKGAIGLMQVMPATWDELRAKHGLGDDPWQPRDNILAGAAYLREMHDRYGTTGGMLAAYNAGPGRYDGHLSTGRALPDETIDYVAKITPMIDGTAAIRRSVGRRLSSSWSRAPLFVGRSTIHIEDDPESADLPSGSMSDAPAIVDLSALVPPSDGTVRAQAGARRSAAMIGVVFRMESRSIVFAADLCWESEATTEERQDKKPHIADLSVGCCYCLFWFYSYIAPSCREVRVFRLSSDFTAERTSRALAP